MRKVLFWRVGGHNDHGDGWEDVKRRAAAEIAAESIGARRVQIVADNHHLHDGAAIHTRRALKEKSGVVPVVLTENLGDRSPDEVTRLLDECDVTIVFVCGDAMLLTRHVIDSMLGTVPPHSALDPGEVVIFDLDEVSARHLGLPA